MARKVCLEVLALMERLIDRALYIMIFTTGIIAYGFHEGDFWWRKG